MNITPFCARLVALRKKHNYTQLYVSNKLCISRQSYDAYEHGRRTPNYETLSRIAELYNVSTDYLIGDYHINCFKDSMDADKYIETIGKELSSSYSKILSERELSSLYSKLPNSSKEKISNMVCHESKKYNNVSLK